MMRSWLAVISSNRKHHHPEQTEAKTQQQGSGVKSKQL